MNNVVAAMHKTECGSSVASVGAHSLGGMSGGSPTSSVRMHGGGYHSDAEDSSDLEVA